MPFEVEITAHYNREDAEYVLALIEGELGRPTVTVSFDAMSEIEAEAKVERINGTLVDQGLTPLPPPVFVRPFNDSHLSYLPRREENGS